MSDLLQSALGAVGAAGEALDKVTGGRALRGALAGKPRELASFIPYSDSMGLTDEKDKTSGRDLTDSYGLTTKGDNSFGSHAAGFLADTVASPLSLMGGFSAFKAAPTLAKGLVAGGKALTGIDAIEHAAGAAKGLAGKAGKFLGGEAGSATARIAPKPVNVGSLHAESLPANASRPRRWSADPAEKAYYAGDRQRRYAQRMTGREIPRNAGPAGVPSFGLGDAIKSFASDERGSFGMPGRVLMPGEGGYDDALKAYEANKHLVAKKGPDGAFVNAIDSMKLPRNVEDTIYHMRDNVQSYGKHFIDGDERTSTDLFHAMSDGVGDFLDDEGGHLNLGKLANHKPGSLISAIKSFGADERGSLNLGAFAGRKPMAPPATAAHPLGHVFDDAAKGMSEHFSGDVRKYLDDSTLPASADPLEFAKKMQGAVEAGQDYKGAGYRRVNHTLRDIPAGELDSEIARMRSEYTPGQFVDKNAPPILDMKDPRHVASGLMDMMDHSRLPTPMSLYRGVSRQGERSIEDLLGVPLRSPEAVGKEFVDPGFLSTTKDKDLADAFAMRFKDQTDQSMAGPIFHFPEVPAGKQGIMFNPGEQEVLFPPGRRIRVDDNSNYPNIKATLYSSILAAMMGGAALHQPQNQNQGM